MRTCNRADDQLRCRGDVLVQPSPAAHHCAGKQPGRSLPQSDVPAVDHYSSRYEWTLRRVSARQRRRRALRDPPDGHRHAKRAALDPRAQTAQQSRITGDRDLSRLRTCVRDGCRLSRPARCAIHMVPGIWRASGGMAGSPALAADNESASSISVKAAHVCCWPVPTKSTARPNVSCQDWTGISWRAAKSTQMTDTVEKLCLRRSAKFLGPTSASFRQRRGGPHQVARLQPAILILALGRSDSRTWLSPRCRAIFVPTQFSSFSTVSTRSGLQPSLTKACSKWSFGVACAP
jgi:hypothetical protein